MPSVYNSIYAGMGVHASNAYQAKGQTMTKYPDGTEVTEEHEIEGTGQLMFDAPPCVISVGSGATMNVGNYNSVKVHASVWVPCAHDELDEVYDFAKGWVENKLGMMVAEVKQSFGL